MHNDKDEYAVRITATVYVQADSPEDAQSRANAALDGIDGEIELHSAEVEKVDV